LWTAFENEKIEKGLTLTINIDPRLYSYGQTIKSKIGIGTICGDKHKYEFCVSYFIEDVNKEMIDSLPDKFGRTYLIWHNLEEEELEPIKSQPKRAKIENSTDLDSIEMYELE